MPLRHYLELGGSKSALARQLGISRDTIHRWIRDGDLDRDLDAAAALIDRLVHHCHLVTIRGNSYRMRQHTDLWQALHATQDADPAAPRCRRTRQEVPTT